MLESEFRKKAIERIEKMYPSAVTIVTDPNHIQGFPDRIVLLPKTWFALETKRAWSSSRRPNQPYWIKTLDSMSFARFLSPENLEEVLHELQQAF